MNVLKFLSVVLFVTIFSACNPNAKQSLTSPKEVEVLSINYSDLDDNIDFTNLFDSIQIVKLETNKQSLIGVIQKILFEHEKYYILDRNSQSVLIFDSNGRFINKLNKLGKGAGEYVELRDFNVDKNGNIIILTYHKLITYNSSTFDLIEERNLSRNAPYNQALLFIQNQNNLFLFSGSFGLTKSNLQEKKDFAINVVDQNSNILNRYFPVTFTYPFMHQTFYKSNENIYLSSTLGNDTIYCIKESHINPVIFVDFEKKITNSEMLDDRNEAFSYVKNNNLMGGITRIYENNHYLCFAFTCGHIRKQAVYNKISKTIKIINVSSESLPFPFILVEGVANNNFFSFANSYVIKECSEKNKRIKELLDRNILSDIKESDNPIIIKFKFTI